MANFKSISENKTELLLSYSQQKQTIFFCYPQRTPCVYPLPFSQDKFEKVPLIINESCKTNNEPPVLTNVKQAFLLSSKTIKVTA